MPLAFTHSRHMLAAAALLLATAAGAQAPLPPPASTTGARYVEPSTTTLPQPDERVGSLLIRSLGNAAIVQKLGPRTWWAHKTFYNALFYVGDQGVLVFDAPQYRTEAILKGIRTVTDKPITAIVYSHFHADHIADVQLLLDDARRSGAKPRLIATTQTASKMKRLGSTLPLPTETVRWPDGSFRFENLQVQVHGFTHAFHTDDHSAWLLKGQGVLHAPDLLNGDQLPFLGFAISEIAVNLPANLRQVGAMKWDWLSGGHGNVATRADLDLYLRYFADLRAALKKASEEIDYFSFVDPAKANNHAEFTAGWQAAVVDAAVEALRPQYGSFYGYTANTRANARFVLQVLDSYL